MNYLAAPAGLSALVRSFVSLLSIAQVESLNGTERVDRRKRLCPEYADECLRLEGHPTGILAGLDLVRYYYKLLSIIICASHASSRFLFARIACHRDMDYFGRRGGPAAPC